MVSQNCVQCNKIFQTKPSYVKRGQGRFCSISCSNRFNKALPKEPNVSCTYCNADFYKPPSKMSNSKSGLFFCSREHKDLAQRIGGIKEIQPDHYGEGKYSKYRTKALRFLEQVCNRCGYQEHPEILQAHHIDHNRSNNDIKNLEMLCPNCHALEHRN